MVCVDLDVRDLLQFKNVSPRAGLELYLDRSSFDSLISLNYQSGIFMNTDTSSKDFLLKQLNELEHANQRGPPKGDWKSRFHAGFSHKSRPEVA